MTHILRDFTNKARTYLKFAYTPDIVNLFHVTHLPPNRLAHYGYVNRLPHTSVHINLHEDAAQALNVAMLNLQHQLTKGHVEQLRSGCPRVKAKRFVGYTTLRAHQQITHLAKVIHDCHGQRIVDFPADCSVVVLYSCPHGHSKLSTFFSPLKVAYNVWCRDCQRAHTSAKWPCPCSKPWHQCPKHVSATELVNRTARTVQVAHRSNV